LAAYSGKCSGCGREYHGSHADVVVCDCWEKCPECGARMEPYAPDLSPNSYGRDGKRDLLILRVCDNHNPPFFSALKPVEVELSESEG
jgi:hypothetical protein